VRDALRTRRGVLVATLSLAGIAFATASTSPAQPSGFALSVAVTPPELTYGATLTVAGALTDAGQNASSVPLALEADPYPFRGFAMVARLDTAPDGSFAFAAVRPNRNTHLRVVVEGAPGVTSPVLPVIVDPNAATSARSLGPGRTRLSLLLRHTPVGISAPVSARWFLAARGSHVLRLVAVTPARELSPSVTYASAMVDPPSKRFVYRVCLNPTWEHAMGAPASHGPCPRHDLSLVRDVG
jgi:hypothetical protein